MWYSCMACSSADCVRGEARLISSAIRSWPKIGPLTKRKERLPFSSWSMTSEPRISDGIRSGVNWMRFAASPSTSPSVVTSLVLARPGTPTSSAVTAGQNREQRLFDDALLAEDDLGNFLADGGDIGQRLLGGGDDGLVVEARFGRFHHAHWRLQQIKEWFDEFAVLKHMPHTQRNLCPRNWLTSAFRMTIS